MPFQTELVKVTVLLFAKAKELCGTDRVELDFPAQLEYSELKASLVSQLSSLEDLKDSIILALNEEYIDQTDAVKLKSGDNIAVIPPISGG